MSVEAVTPSIMRLPIEGKGATVCHLAASLEMVVSLPTGTTCDCGKCPEPVPHVALILTHEIALPYFAALPKATAISVARELLKLAETLPGPKAEPEIEERRK